jgi:hypothetical protein
MISDFLDSVATVLGVIGGYAVIAFVLGGF